MRDIWIERTSMPIRKTEVETGRFLLYNTSTLSSICLDHTAIVIWDYLKKSKQVSLNEIVDYILKVYKISPEKKAEIYSDCFDLIHFFTDHCFVERTELDG